MDTRHTDKREDLADAVQTSSNQGSRALAKAITELVDHGVIPLRQQIEYLGQACVFLEQAWQVASVSRETRVSGTGDKTGNSRSHWDWFLLHKDEHLRAGVLTIDPYRPIPIHDHPGTSGILLVLEGHLIEHHYQLDPSSESSTGTVQLIPGNTRYLDAGHWSVFMPDWNNLHSLSAMGRAAVVFSLQFNPSTEPVRSWFLPTDTNRDGAIQAVRSHEGMFATKTV